MATVVLFHSALGLRPGVHRFADDLREAGHTVHTPDLYGGRTADDTDAGVRLRDEVGFTTLLARAEASLLGLDGPLVLAGMSMGCAPAQLLAVDRPATRGVVCLHGALSPDDLGLGGWPRVPLQLHLSPDDPWVDRASVDGLLASAGDDVEVHRYPGTGHLFTDPDLADHDPVARAEVLTRVGTALARWDAV